MDKRLETTFLDSKFKNPIVTASGTFGFGREYSEFFNPDILGGISSKGLTLHAQAGNSGRRLFETPSGLLNSIGLENPGVQGFVDTELDYMNSLGTKVIVNFGAHSKEDFLEGINLLNEEELDFIELNISCPNVKEGGMAFCMKEETAAEITSAVKEISQHKIIVKLSPNAPSIVDIAKSVEGAGADAISMVNTFLGMAIDIEKKEKVFDNTYAGLSGAGIKPIALRMVHEVAKEVDIPILAYGGVSSYIDIIEFIMAGATLVGVGSAIFSNPHIIEEMLADLSAYADKHNLENLEEIRGIIK